MGCPGVSGASARRQGQLCAWIYAAEKEGMRGYLTADGREDIPFDSLALGGDLQRPHRLRS